MAIHHLVTPLFFMSKLFSMKLRLDQEHSDYFITLGSTELSHNGSCPAEGEKPKKGCKLKKNSLN